MPSLRRFVVAVVTTLAATVSAVAQDLYDTTVLRTINLTFHDANWLQLLRNNYFSETLILADMVVDGVTYPSVGVRIRGNTSYTALPPTSEKFSLKIELDHVNPDQDIMGYDNLNLNNGFRDPTFCREVVYNNFVGQFIPNSRANHVLVTLNGQNWGVYINVQQPDKAMLRNYFADNDGLRVSCPNNPNGPGLRYNGPTPSGYSGYEINNDGGLADPWFAFIMVCNIVTNQPLATWQNIDNYLAIDPSTWSVVLENLLTDDDSYVNKGADFFIYRDPVDGRTHLLQRDANETFTQFNWEITRNFTHINRPVLSRVLSVPQLRQRYMSHYRHAKTNLNWAYFEPIFTAHRNLIDAHVQADPKKLYSYALFQQNFTTTVNMPLPGLAGGNIIGLQQFVTQRASFLNSNAELNAVGPTITNVQASASAPNPSQPVWITAQVSPAGNPIAGVELFFRPSPAGVYQRVPMLDNGLSGDGAAGDGVYGALLPITATGGQRVAYYVGATASNAFTSSTFSPALAERGPLYLDYLFGQGGVRITEFMYQGPSGEFIEFTNLTSKPVDMTGWSMDDDSGVAGTVDLSAAGILAPGESFILTESTPAVFAAAWNLTGVTILGPFLNANLGRNDTIHLYDADDNLVDRLRFGDQDYPGTIRTQNISGQACHEFIGLDDIFGWVLSSAGDQFGSVTATTGERGTPGSYNPNACGSACPADLNGDGAVGPADLGQLLGAWGSPGCGGSKPCPADLNGDGNVGAADLGALLGAWGPCNK